MTVKMIADVQIKIPVHIAKILKYLFMSLLFWGGFV